MVWGHRDFFSLLPWWKIHTRCRCALLLLLVKVNMGFFLTGHSYPENVLHIFVVMTDLKVCVTCKYITHVWYVVWCGWWDQAMVSCNQFIDFKICYQWFKRTKQINHSGGFTSTTFSSTLTIFWPWNSTLPVLTFSGLCFELNCIGLHIPSQGAGMEHTKHC